MPTYEFRCPDGTLIERVYKMSEVPDSIPSPKGDGMAVRIISGGADLIFKGSGFYITDYGKDGKKDRRKNENESAKSEAVKSEGKDTGEGKKPGGTEAKAETAVAPPSPPPTAPKGDKKKSGPSSDAAA